VNFVTNVADDVRGRLRRECSTVTAHFRSQCGRADPRMLAVPSGGQCGCPVPAVRRPIWTYPGLRWVLTSGLCSQVKPLAF
jgi:hypothetical protein